MSSEIVVTARPQRLRWVCWGSAGVIVAFFGVLAMALRGTTEGGGVFAAGDQAAMVGLGIALAVGVLLFTRPRVIADTRKIVVRNVVTTVELPWQVVRAVRFDDRSPWATLELHDDDTVPLLAVQVVDGDYALAAVQGLRRLHSASV